MKREHDLVVRNARTQAEVNACKAMISRVYRARYGVRMTLRQSDPDGRLERYPDRFTMGFVGGELAACSGLYVDRTYVQTYGGVTDEEIDAVATDAGIDPRGRRRVEYTKVVVRPGAEGQGVGRSYIGASHARAFLSLEDGQLPLVLVCARLSTFALWEAVGIHTRALKPFPWYRNHERYRSASDPMESRLVVPELDVAKHWFEYASIEELALDRLGASHAH